MAVERPRHSQQFRIRRTQNWLAMGLTYAAMYMARYNFGFANKSLSDTYGWSRAQVGGIITVATGGCIFNFLFGLGAYLGFLGTGPVLLGYLATIWTLNMYFQSYSALALIKVNSGWFHVNERGVFSAVFGS